MSFIAQNLFFYSKVVVISSLTFMFVPRINPFFFVIKIMKYIKGKYHSRCIIAHFLYLGAIRIIIVRARNKHHFSANFISTKTEMPQKYISPYTFSSNAWVLLWVYKRSPDSEALTILINVKELKQGSINVRYVRGLIIKQRGAKIMKNKKEQKKKEKYVAHVSTCALLLSTKKKKEKKNSPI